MSAAEVVHFVPSPASAPESDVVTAEQAGPAIISLLRQAAEAAKRNEERARALVLRMSDELRQREERLAELEARLMQYKERAETAEQWLLHIHDEVQTRLIDPARTERV